MSIDFSSLPIWATLLKRFVTILVLVAFGTHAYVQYRRRNKSSASERWVYLSFSFMLMVAVLANIASAIMAAALDLKQGPYNTGIFSLLLFILYLIFAGGVGGRTKF